MDIVYLETIRYNGGQYFNLEYHKHRVLYTVRDDNVWCDICKVLKVLPVGHLSGDVKCTIEYCASRGVIAWRVAEYKPVKIKRLVPVVSDIDYRYKYADREELVSLKNGLVDGEEPIIIKNGLVTDTTFSNIVFKCADGMLVTPRKPLLYGTKRAQLLHDGVIVERDIFEDQIYDFEEIYIINAMRDI